MKIRLMTLGVLLSVITQAVMADEIDSKVIHNYRYLSAGYGYLNDIGDSGVNAHGAVGAFSFEEQNFLLSVSGGYFWGDDSNVDLNLWNVNPAIGYVVRLMGNHINIIPNVAGSYAGVEVDVPGLGSASDESWSILPGIDLSFAINNRFAINGGYTYAYNFDAEDEDHLFHVGGKVAVLDQLGLSVSAMFSKEFGFSGITGSIEFHY